VQLGQRDNKGRNGAGGWHQGGVWRRRSRSVAVQWWWPTVGQHELGTRLGREVGEVRLCPDWLTDGVRVYTKWKTCSSEPPQTDPKFEVGLGINGRKSAVVVASCPLREPHWGLFSAFLARTDTGRKGEAAEKRGRSDWNASGVANGWASTYTKLTTCSSGPPKTYLKYELVLGRNEQKTWATHASH
jgi:hypothetical protein